MNLANWLDYIESLHPQLINLGLERIQRLADQYLHAFDCPVITVAGTNGKGSVVRFLEMIYLESGRRVAAYTSPHILQFNERLRINGQSVSDALLLEAFEFVESIRKEERLTFFEFTTLSALIICQQLSLDVVLLEIGLGGRLDAVNVVPSDAAVITTIDIDHADWLGNDCESIAREKAGIIRRQNPVIFGDVDMPDSIEEVAQSLDAPLYRRDHHFKIEKANETWSWVGPSRSYDGLPYPHLKLQNAATSLMVVDLFQKRLPVSVLAIREGLRKSTLIGRFEIVQSEICPIIFDVAHNLQATDYLAQQLGASPISGRTLAVVAILKDKEAAGMLRALQFQIEAWFVGSLTGPRGRTSGDLVNILTALGAKNCYNFDSVAVAFEQALAYANPEDRILVFGSFYTVAMAKQYLQHLMSGEKRENYCEI